MLLVLLAFPIGAAAAPSPTSPPLIQTLTTPRAVLAKLSADDTAGPSRAQTEHVVRWQHGVRDLVRSTTQSLLSLATDAAFHLPDLSVLTTSPILNGESSGFGWRDDPFRHRAKFHSGTDFRGKHGTPVLAAGDGIVVFTGRYHGYGNMVDVDHGGGVTTRYAHLRRIETAVDRVITAGEQLGQVGSTGRATGPHLHFEVRLDRRPVDPVLAMSVGELTRESPAAGQVAAAALSPALQYRATSQVDPPRGKRTATGKETRPERRGRVARVKPLS